MITNIRQLEAILRALRLASAEIAQIETTALAPANMTPPTNRLRRTVRPLIWVKLLNVPKLGRRCHLDQELMILQRNSVMTQNHSKSKEDLKIKDNSKYLHLGNTIQKTT